MVTVGAVILIGYLLGSIATGVWLGKIIKGIDIREHGSKSTGATNVFRVLGWKLAVAALIVDIAKGYFACLAGSLVNFGDIAMSSIQLAMLGGLAAIIGHLFPVFAGFKGGKGVAAGAGMLLFLAPLELGFALIIFLFTVFLTGYVSLGSMLAALFFSVSVLVEIYYLRYPLGGEIALLAVLLFSLVIFTHRANIGRLLKGNENRFGAKKVSEMKQAENNKSTAG